VGDWRPQDLTGFHLDLKNIKTLHYTQTDTDTQTYIETDRQRDIETDRQTDRQYAGRCSVVESVCLYRTHSTQHYTVADQSHQYLQQLTVVTTLHSS